MRNRAKCDMCGTTIENGRCSCGSWKDHHEQSEGEAYMKKSLEAFHEMRQMIFTGDMPHLGVACIYFRGDYNDCKIIESFIKNLKGRPYYEKQS